MLRRTATTSFQNAIHPCYYQLYPHANADAGQRSTGKHHFRHGGTNAIHSQSSGLWQFRRYAPQGF